MVTEIAKEERVLGMKKLSNLWNVPDRSDEVRTEMIFFLISSQITFLKNQFKILHIIINNLHQHKTYSIGSHEVISLSHNHY